jgi:chemotaxis protein methyltransferase CheR
MSTASTASLDARSFEFVRRLVLERCSIALEETKGYLVESRLAPLAKSHGMASVSDLVWRLQSTPHSPLHEQVVDAMTTNETSFFRDVHPFDTLKATILPELIERRASRRTLNIWSAACSSGQEPYTIAIIVRDHFPQLSDWNVKIFASDFSHKMLERAASGVYSQVEVNRGLPATALVKHFQREGLNWVVKAETRNLVKFLRLNLTESWSMLPTMDLVFMRNVLIYFTSQTKRLILEKVHRQLARDGTLLLGGAETTLGLCDHFERVSVGKTTLYRPLGAVAGSNH